MKFINSKGKTFVTDKPFEDLKKGDYILVSDKEQALREIFEFEESSLEFYKKSDMELSKKGISIKL